MKKFLSLALSAVMLASALASCAPAEDRLDPAITLASSDARANAEWLQTRLGGEFPDDVVIGIGSNGKYGVDMTDFEDDGYIVRTLGDETLIFGATEDGLDRAVRKYAKAADADATAELDEVYHEGYRVERLTVAGADISEYTVVYPAGDSGNARLAAEEFARLIKEACGAVLPVYAEDTAPATDRLVRIVYTEDSALKESGYRYYVSGTSLTIEGASANGCTNGVYRFLQNECGWENLIFGDSVLLEADSIDITDGLDVTEVPMADYFYAYSAFRYPYDNDRTASMQSYRGRVSNAGHGLQTNNFDEFGAEQTLMCYTDDTMYYTVYDNVMAYIARMRESGRQIGVDFFDVDISQRDSNDYCDCKTCLKVYKEEGYTNAGPVVRFANRLSEEVSETYPGLVYKIYAYAGSNKPPKTAPNDMLYITFCYDMSCSNHPLDGSECTTDVKNTYLSAERNNAIFTEWFSGWCDISDNMYLWVYVLDAGLQQLTVLDTLYEDFKFMNESGIKGLFWQIPYYGFGIKRIEQQLGAALNYDTDMTEEEYTELYHKLLEQEYGDGWENVLRYIELWNLAQDRGGCYHCWGWTEHGSNTYDIATCAEYFDESVALIEEAISLANSAEQEARLEVLSCHLYYDGCYSSYFPAYDAGDADRIAVLDERYDLMISRMKEHGFDPARIVTVDGAINTYLEDLEAEAWTYWEGYRSVVVPDKSTWRDAPTGYEN